MGTTVPPAVAAGQHDPDRTDRAPSRRLAASSRRSWSSPTSRRGRSELRRPRPRSQPTRAGAPRRRAWGPGTPRASSTLLPWPPGRIGSWSSWPVLGRDPHPGAHAPPRGPRRWRWRPSTGVHPKGARKGRAPAEVREGRLHELRSPHPLAVAAPPCLGLRSPSPAPQRAPTSASISIPIMLCRRPRSRSGEPRGFHGPGAGDPSWAWPSSLLRWRDLRRMTRWPSSRRAAPPPPSPPRPLTLITHHGRQPWPTQRRDSSLWSR